MRSISTHLSVVCTILCLSTNLYAATAADAVHTEGAYVRAVPPGQPNSAAFMKLTNQGETDHALVGAASEVSKVAELHTHLLADGMMKMRRVQKIDLPAGETTRLQPGGLHIMLINLTTQISPGDDVKIDLIFEDGSRASLTAPVKTVQETMMHQSD